MLSKAQNKYIRSLSHQKFRKEFNVFIAEGDKIATEWLVSAAPIQMIVSIEQWADIHKELIARHPEATLHIVTEAELTQLSTLQTPNQVLLVVHMPAADDQLPNNEWCIALDSIQDPGNMGTIIRIADWFGINHIVCSPDCADVYNPKVVQAAMGGHLRIKLHKMDLPTFLSQISMPILAATLDGENIYNIDRLPAGVLIIGNESKGVSEELINRATRKITIPKRGGAESLNAGVSAGIVCALLLPVN